MFASASVLCLHLFALAWIDTGSDPIRCRQDQVADATPKAKIPSTVRTSSTKYLLSAE